jgi:regulator of replication initiation timing
MQERIHQDKNSNHYQGLRAELIKLREENERLKRESNKLRQQMAKDKTVITYLRKATPSTRGKQMGRAIRLETPVLGTPDDIKKNKMESFSERKRKRTTTFSGNSDPSDDSETDAGVNEEIERGRRGNDSKDTRLKRLEATVEELIQRSGQVT